MKLHLLAVSTALAISAGAAAASTVDFSENNGTMLNHGDFIDGAFDFGNGLTGTVSTSGGSGTAQVYDSRVKDTSIKKKNRDDDLYFGLRSPLGNVLIVNEDKSRADDNARGGVITFMFDKMVKFTGLTLVDLERHQPVTITADGGFDSGLQFNGDNEFSAYSTGTPVFTKSLTLSFKGSGAIDNLELSAVPLPASALLLLGGFGGLGALRRRKKS